MYRIRRQPQTTVVAIGLAALLGAAAARADEPAADDGPPAAGETTSDPGTDETEIGEAADEVILITEDWPRGPAVPAHRAGSDVGRADLERRLPRSAPDALRYEPGVFVQQTAHSQGSAFIRGLTGQQTLLMFDGIRLNNSTYRQGPNQYFFTLDSQSIDAIRLVRGGASTRYGSDAVGGVIMAIPIEAELDTTDAPWTARSHLRLRGATADDEAGARVQSHVTLDRDWAFVGGVGGRRVGRLESGGVVRNPQNGEPPEVPRFADDGRTQLGTGFDEVTADGRLHYRASPTNAIKLAAYTYRQLDAPRTDQCPAAFAPFDECLTYDEQFRTLVYGAWEATPGAAAIDRLRLTASWQLQRERRTLSRPSAQVDNIGRDRVSTLGVAVNGRSRGSRPTSWLHGQLHYGADTYHDRVDSAAWIQFTDIDSVQRRSRGQYLDGSRYTYGGVFVDAAMVIGSAVTARVGGRLSWIAARAPADPDSGSSAVDELWLPLVGNAGLEWRTGRRLDLLTNVDRSFRAPNLDDLTSRQQTGPGFQFENPALEPERATTLEAGARLRGRITGELWAFRTAIDGAVIKRPRPQSACPAETPQCQAAWTRFQLVNADSGSQVRGLEASLYGPLTPDLTARASAAWTRGEGPNVGDRPADPNAPFTERVPLSRIPPLNGSAELMWRRAGLSASAGLRWAMRQDRLALADIDDQRIPLGGTPGFAVLDLRVGYRTGDDLLVSLALENLLDAAYRYHGSSVNGPGRGLVVLIDAGAVIR